MLCKALLLLVLVSYVLATALSSSMQTQVLQRHNAKRAGVVPAASPSIPALVWDANLATVASNYANNCVWGHSTNGFGENLGAAYSSSGFIGEAQTLSSVDSWDNEKADYTLSSNTCAPGKVCGHYTQVVWANSVRLGCGYANCPANTNPFGSGTGWTISVCNYDPPGNYIGQKPYNAGTGSNSCTPSCPANACGTVTSSCGTPISCSCPSGSYCNGNTCATCTSPCTAGVCGLKNSTNCPSTQYNCGNCASGQACGSNNVCQATTPACTNTICTANGRTCGSFSDASCTGSVSCGTCASGQTCTNGVCVAPPCNGACSSPSQTCNSGSNTCSCSAGYSLVNNVCTVQSNSNPSWNNDFTVLSGSDTASVTGNALSIIGTSSTPSVVRFARSSAAINPYWTKATVEVTQTTGTFGFGFRIGDKNGYADDGVYVFATNIGTPSYGMSFDWKWYGGWENPSPAISPYSQSKWRTSGPMTVSSWMTKNDTTGLTTVYTKTAYTEIVNGYSSSYSACYGVSVYSSDLGPNTGSVAFYSKRSSGSTSISKFTLATATTLSVSLSSCINDADWIAMFRTLTGCSTCTVTARAVGENARCKAAGAKEAASAFIVVVESSTVASEAVAGSFLAAVESGSAAAAPLAVKSAAIIAGTEGAVLAGLPEAGVIVTAGGAAAGAGGGGAGGLSGGAIAGIVVGSVAGAVLIVGITAIVVAAVIVAAVVVAKKASDSDDESGPSRADPENNKRGSIRETIYNIFRGPRGGVDVMNNPAGGHQSITARAPKM